MNIEIRDYKAGEEKAIWEVFYSSIHQACTNQYSQVQRNAWAPKNYDSNTWIAKIQRIKPFVATLDGNIVGYSDLQDDGKIDHFFVHGDHQRTGIANHLMSEILLRGNDKIMLYSEVSQTAKPFFERHGFELVKEQIVNIRGVNLANNLMQNLLKKS